MVARIRKKRLLLLLVFFLLIMGCFVFFGEKGVLRLFRLQKELERFKEASSKLAEENRKLEEEVKRLREDKQYIEEIARRELGMVKEGEVIYRFDSPAAPKESLK